MALIWLALVAWAGPDEAFAEARAAARRGDLTGEYAACAVVVDAAPATRPAEACRRRLAFLDARRDAGGTLAQYEALEQVRIHWREAPAEVSRSHVQAIFAAAPAGEALWTEAGIWLAHDALGRLGDPALALETTAALYDARIPPDLRRQVVGLHARALALAGRLAEAEVVEAEIRVSSRAPRATPVEQVARDRRLALTARAAWGSVGAFAVLAAPLAVRARPRALPLGLVPLWVALVGTGALAELWSRGAGAGVPWMAVGLTIVHVLSAGALARAGRLAPLVRVLAAIASVATVFLALHHTDTLRWVGL